MPKIEEITYESDMETFIDYAAISSYVSELKNTLENINTNVLNVLDSEINTGGLDIYAANINGRPIFHDKAIETEQKVQAVYTECKEIADQIENEAKTHRKDELTKYITELENRITKLEGENKELLEQLKAANSALSQDVQANPSLYADGYMIYTNSNYLKAQSIQGQINNNNKELDGSLFYGKGLKEKLKEAQKELNALN